MKAPLRLLLVEDSEMDARFLLHELRRGGYELISERVETPEEMAAALDSADWDVIVSDYFVMPGFDAPDALALLRKKGLDLPFIVVSGKVGEDRAVAAMKAGAHDYVMKSNLARLGPAIERELREAENRRERRRAEEAQRQSEELYRSVVEQAAENIFLVDIETGRILEANDALHVSLGYKAEELRQLTLYDIVAHDRESIDQNIRRILEGHSFVGEQQYRRKDGSLMDVEVSASAIDHNGKEAMCIVAHDVTERKRTEQRLAVQYAVARILAEAATLGEAAPKILEAVAENQGWKVGEFWSRDRQAGVLRRVEAWSAPSVNVLGFAEDTRQSASSQGAGLPGRVWATGEVVWLPDVVEDDDFLRKDDARKEKLHGACAFPIFLGEEVLGVMSFFCQEIRQPDKETLEMMAAIGSQIEQFIERRWAEEELRESEAHKAAILKSALDCIITMDHRGRITEFNPAAEQTFGYRRDEVLGKQLADVIIPPAMREQHRRGLAHYLATGEGPVLGRRIELTALRADGTEFPVELAIVAGRRDERPMFTGYLRDITERKMLEEQLSYQAFHDALTGLPNRLMFMDRLEHALARTQRSGDSVAVLFMDLDNFKLVNDSLGHEAGDQLLIAVARRLKSCLRHADTVARLGGDEFTVLLENISEVSEAGRVADRVAEELQKPFVLKGLEVFTSASIGIAISASYGKSAQDLMRNADLAMYGAKRGGKARYRMFELGMDAAAHTRLELEADLRGALERGELKLHYQPEVLLEDGRIVGFEALLRWEHPERGLLSPVEFVSLAEETGLIVTIGQWVLKEACNQAEEWRRRYPSDPPLKISVNLSATQFQQENLSRDIAQVLEATGLPASSLNLEITENVVMSDALSTVSILQELRELGVQLSIDDFGTGYSSLAYLKRFPVDFFKVDRSFVGHIGEDGGTEDLLIISGIVSLARNLGFTVIAEGVETIGQLERLQELGCDLAQGFYFSKPLPASEVDDLLSEIGASGEPDQAGAEALRPLPGSSAFSN